MKEREVMTTADEKYIATMVPERAKEWYSIYYAIAILPGLMHTPNAFFKTNAISRVSDSHHPCSYPNQNTISMFSMPPSTQTPAPHDQIPTHHVSPVQQARWAQCAV